MNETVERVVILLLMGLFIWLATYGLSLLAGVADVPGG